MKLSLYVNNLKILTYTYNLAMKSINPQNAPTKFLCHGLLPIVPSGKKNALMTQIKGFFGSKIIKTILEAVKINP